MLSSQWLHNKTFAKRNNPIHSQAREYLNAPAVGLHPVMFGFCWCSGSDDFDL